MAGVPKRLLRPALLGWGLVCGLVFGPVLFVGVRDLDSGGWDTVGAWFMVVGGSMALVAGSQCWYCSGGNPLSDRPDVSEAALSLSGPLTGISAR